MKKILLFILTIGLVACERDFDEIADTTQRHVMLQFNLADVCNDILFQSGNSFQLGTSSVTADDYRLRVSVYCYDGKDSLISHQQILSDHSEVPTCIVRHLEKGEQYNFVVMADVVKIDPYVDFYETWFQLGTKWSHSFYLVGYDRSDNSIQNVLFYKKMTLTPENQIVDVKLEQITNNGFCQFVNARHVDKLSGYVAYFDSFLLHPFKSMTTARQTHSFEYVNPDEATILLPVTVSIVDSVIPVVMRTITLEKNDTNRVIINNTKHRPFVATFDCKTLQLTDCKYY